MERWTISSTSPKVEELPGLTPDQAAALKNAGQSSVFDLVEVDIVALADATGMGVIAADRVSEMARLVTLRGIGTSHAATLESMGIRGVCDLAARNPVSLFRDIDATRTHARRNLAEVRVWIRAAARACYS